MTVNYTELIKKAKLAARDILRTEKVHALEGYKNTVNSKIKHLKEEIEEITREIKLVEYDLAIKTHFTHPDLAEFVKNFEAKQKSSNEYIENVNKEIKTHEEKLAEYDTKIAKWHSGESKVDLERLRELTLKLAQEKIGSNFSVGDYEAAETNVVNGETA